VALAVPTLLGIALVTFGLVHLAPGDPLDAGAAGALSGGKRAGEEVRRLYFLDLPLFINPRPRGLGQRVERLAAALERDGGAAAGSVAAAVRCGTVCVPGLARRLSSEGQGGAGRGPVVAALEAVRRKNPAAGPTSGDLDAWLAALLPRLEPSALDAMGQRLGQGPGDERALAALGSAALPAVMSAALDGEGQRRAAGQRVARAITGHGGGGLDEYWYRARRDHVTYGAWERAAGVLTETRFARWLGRLVTLRLGHSFKDGRPVSAKLAEALPVTLLLSLLSLALAYLLAVPLGVYGAVRRGDRAERALTVLLFTLYSMPPFWLAMLLILVFGGVGLLSWFPIYGLASPGLEQAGGLTWLVDRAHHLVLPVVCLTYGSLAVLSRYQRSAMLEVLEQEYIRSARARGLGEARVVLGHALPNALLPTVTLLGLQLPYLISGSVIIERIFNIPGMGMLTFQAFLDRDYPVIMAVSVLAAALTLLGLMLADLAQAALDPRVHLEGERS